MNQFINGKSRNVGFKKYQFTVSFHCRVYLLWNHYYMWGSMFIGICQSVPGLLGLNLIGRKLGMILINNGVKQMLVYYTFARM